jgi:F-type H+-transporting ATPase subunit gamma
MRRAAIIEQDADQIDTVEGLTGVFESIASTHIAKVRRKVELSTVFFKLLWRHYTSLRINPATRITNRTLGSDLAKTALIIISAEAGLSGDIDQRLIDMMLQDENQANADIIVLGSHGASQLMQRGIKFTRYFQVPVSDNYIDVSPVVEAIQDYSRTVVYYEEYVSLGLQEVRKLDLISSIRDMSDQPGDDIMTPEDTIFEPSIDEIANEMEVTMMTIVLSQTILESSLAQAASRFNAMAVAKKRASQLLDDYLLELHRAKRFEIDRRMQEVLVSLKEKRKRTGVRR